MSDLLTGLLLIGLGALGVLGIVAIGCLLLAEAGVTCAAAIKCEMATTPEECAPVNRLVRRTTVGVLFLTAPTWLLVGAEVGSYPFAFWALAAATMAAAIWLAVRRPARSATTPPAA
jgi:hypothetical protein